jgi:ADP-ribosylglycohydrolase
LSYPSGLTGFRKWPGWTAGPKGTYTDDTQLTMVVAEWLIAAGSAAPEGADLADRLCMWLPQGRGVGAATRAAARRLITGEPWWQAGTPSAGNGAAMRVAPVGLRFAGQAHDMRHAAMIASIPTHKDWTAVASAIVQAAAVGLCLSTTAEALEPETFLQHLGESVSDLQLPALVLRSDPAEQRTLVQQIAEVHQWVGRPANEVFDHFYNGAFVMETVPVVLWSLLEFRDDPEGALAEVVMGGRDADTNAAMLGNLLGALHGESVFPSSLARLQPGIGKHPPGPG